MCHDPTVMNTSFYNQIEMRKIEIDENYNLNESIEKYKNISTIEFVFKNKLYLNTKIIFPLNLETSHADRFKLKHNKQWAKEHEAECETENFLPYYSINKNIFYEENNSSLQIGIHSKNSFCNSALPILFYLGFGEIYLSGVDYSDKGYFFSKTDNHQGYIKKENQDFEKLMKFSDKIEHKPKIYSTYHNETKICGKDGFVEFDKLIKEN